MLSARRSKAFALSRSPPIFQGPSRPLDCTRLAQKRSENSSRSLGDPLESASPRWYAQICAGLEVVRINPRAKSRAAARCTSAFAIATC